MGNRPQWTRYRTTAVVVAALMLVSFLGPQHALCSAGPHAEHGTHTAALSEAPADKHGCLVDHQRRPDVRADRTPAASRSDR